MDNNHLVFYIRLPLAGATAEQLANGTGYHTAMRATTPEIAGECVRMLCTATSVETDHIRVELRREL